MYSTPNASSALAILILVAVSKKALANCSPSTGRNHGLLRQLLETSENTELAPQRTSQCAFDDVEIGDIAEKVRVSRRVGICLMNSCRSSPMNRRILGDTIDLAVDRMDTV